MDVRLPDGTVIRNVPEGTTKAQLIERLKRNGYDVSSLMGVQPAPEAERTLGGYAKETLKGLGAGLVGLGETAVTGAAALLPEEAEQSVRKAVTGVTQPIQEYLAPEAGYEETIPRKLSEAVGSTLPFLPLGALGAAGRIAATGLGVATGAGEARQRAEQEVVTEGERGLATALGTIPGALESLPPIRILRRFGFGDEAIQEVAGLVPALTRVAKAGGEEALQEASSQVLQNLIAKGVYKPEEAVFGGVGEAAAMGGGAGAVVSAIAELALGRRLRGPEAEPVPTAEEETELALTPEELAPKAEPAKPSPIRARTAEELGIAVPPVVTEEAPPIEAEEAPPVAVEEAAPRLVTPYEQVKPPEPQAVQEAADFVAQFEGDKKFNLFKARAIARKLGYKGITNKTTRAEVEPLLRQAVAPVEDITVPETAVLPTVEAPPVEPAKLTDIPEIKIARTKLPEVPQLAQDAVQAGSFENFKRGFLSDIKHGKYYHITENPNFDVNKELGPRDMSSMAMGEPTPGALMVTSDPEAWAEYYGKDRPYMVEVDLSEIPYNQLRQVNRGMGNEFFIEDATKAKVVKVAPIEEMLDSYKQYQAKLPQSESELRQVYEIATEASREPIRTSVAEAVTGAAPRGIELPVSRERPAGPEVAAPPIAGLEPISVAAPRVAEGKAVEPAALKPVESAVDKFDDEQIKELAPLAYKSREKLIEMPIETFLALAPKGKMAEKEKGVSKIFEEGKKFSSVPYLYAYPDEGGNLKIEGHEGRHRARKLLEAGYKTMPVVIKGSIRWSEQMNPESFDYEKSWPQKVISQDGYTEVPMFFSREDAVKDYAPEIKPFTEAPTEQRFLSLDNLNRTTPALPEQTKDRAPSLRRELGKAIAQYDAGKLTGDDVANRAGMLLLQTQKERVVQPRQRGPEFVRERLMNASRNGELDPQGVEIASWFIQQNPVLANDLAISIRQRPEEMQGTAAFYNPVNRMVTLFKDAGDERTAVHEILHHTERLMPTNIRAGLLKAYTRQLLKAQKKAKTAEEKAFFKAIVDEQLGEGTPAAYKDALDAIKNARINKSYYQYVNPSEFWAVNASRIVQNRYGVPPTVTGQLKRWLREFIEKVKSALGLGSDAAAIRALDSLVKADGKYKTEAMLALAPEYLSVEPTQKGKIKKPEGTVESVVNLRRQASDKIAKPGIIKQAVEKLTSPETGYEKLAKNFQDDARYIRKLESDLRQAGKLIHVGNDKNNVSSATAVAANRGSYIVATEVEPVVRRLKESVLAYAKATNSTVKNALEKAEAYFIALHEPERRETKYLRNVPLNKTIKLEFLPGEGPMTAADARVKLEERRSLAKTDAEAAAIQDVMRYLAANYADSRGFSPVKARLEDAGKPTPEEMTTDFYDKIYNVIGPEYTQEALAAARAEYESSPDKALIDQIQADLKAVHELNKNLNRRANYWTDKVDRVIASYGWKNYVPFKGSPKADKTFDTDTEFLSGDLSETAESFEGRRTNFDSPILQTIAESYFAASRAGRGTDVTQTIKNLIQQGVIKTKTKKPKIFTFEERNAPDFDYNQVRGRDKVLHYNDDGSVEVYSIENPEVLEAIKKPYREMNWATKLGNNITGTLGQMHTRFNPAFPPMDFIRNSLTNASLIAAREGGAKAREYIAAVSANVGRNGLWKSGKLSKLLSESRTEELTKLLKSKDPFYQDAIDMMRLGGRTMYRMSFNISDTMDELTKQLGPDKIIREPNQLIKYVDAYNDAFELTSRVGAYTIRKEQNIAEAKKRGLDVSNPEVLEDIKKEAAAFALSLMDFRKIGKYGREMGAWFMFIRPAATGAVDAIDALRPAFQTPQKIYDRLSPEVKELFETNTLAQEVQRLQKSEKPNETKIAELQAEIANRQKAFKDFEARQTARIKTARAVIGTYIALGAALYGLAAAVAGEDDEGRNRIETDDMSRWTRYLRLPVIGDEGFLQIPWGFGVSGLAAFGAQSAALARGNSDFKEFLGNSIEIGIDSYLPIPASRINPFDNFGAWLLDSATPSAARPLVEYLINVDAMGNPIYNSRAGKYADAFTGSSRPSEIHREVSQFLFNTTNGKVDVSPDTIAFMLNNYADAPNHLAENSWNLALTAMGDKQFDAKKDTFVLRSFIGRNSNYDARKFAEAEKEIQKLSRRLKTIEEFGSPEQLDRFFQEHPNGDLLVDIYNKGVNGRLRKLQQERNEIRRDPTLTPKERKELLDDLAIEENYVKKGLVEDFEAYKN